jgi:hypothetical protein
MGLQLPFLGSWAAEPGDTDAVPGDATEAAHGIEDKIVMRRLVHDMAPCFNLLTEIVQPGRKFNPNSAIISGRSALTSLAASL